MPTSIDPQPAENEIECARCGAYVYYELARCPNCGVNLYEPEDGEDWVPPRAGSRRKGLLERLVDLFHRITKRPHPADELFGTAIDQAEMFNDLLVKVGGDRRTAERLIEYERRQMPQGNRIQWMENAIRRWERDNRVD